MTQTTTSGPQQAVGMPAVDLRQMFGGFLNAEGVRTSADFIVAQRGAGANMSVDVAAGSSVIQDDHAGGGGYYAYTLATTTNFAVTASHATLPRIDRVVIRVLDQYMGDASNSLGVAVIAGTPTTGATLVNLSGAAAVPGSSLLIANVLVPATSTTVTTANIDTSGASNNSPRVRPVLGSITSGLVDGMGSDIAAASVVTVDHKVHRVSGATAIQQIQGPGGTTPTGGMVVVLISVGGTITYNSLANIFATGAGGTRTVAQHVAVTFAYDGTLNQWNCAGVGS